MKRIDEAKCFVLDLDGTIYLGDEIIDGAVDFINELNTDIKTGINSDITSILVLSGETKADDYSKSNIKADFVYNSVKEIINELNKKYN